MFLNVYYIIMYMTNTCLYIYCEYKIADKFLTWGWTKRKGTKKFAPVGYFKWDKNNKYGEKNVDKLKKNILIVASAFPRYTGHIYAGDLSCSQWERYFQELSLLIKNIDDYLLKPMGESFFQWNMQFNDDNPDIIGDLEIKPKGAASVMQKEVRSQRLIALLQTVANPMLAPFIKIPNLIRELAISQDIDPDSLVNDMNQAKIYAEMLKGMQPDAQQGQQQPESGSPQSPSPNSGQSPSMGAPQQPAQGTQPTDLTGSGDVRRSNESQTSDM